MRKDLSLEEISKIKIEALMGATSLEELARLTGAHIEDRFTHVIASISALSIDIRKLRSSLRKRDLLDESDSSAGKKKD